MVVWGAVIVAAAIVTAAIVAPPAHGQTRVTGVPSGGPGTPPAAGAAPGSPPTGVKIDEAAQERLQRRERRARRGANKPGAEAGPAAAAPAAGAPAAATGGAATGAGGAAGGADAADREFNSCQKFPANKRIVKLNLKPETELGDLISWISSITCRQFILPGTIPANSKKVTVVAPQLITPEEAYRLFLAALDSVGLTVQESGKFYRIIETPKAKTSAPITGTDGETLPGDRYITRLLRVEHADVNEVSQVLGRLKTEQGDVIVYAPQGALIITDVQSSVNRMIKIVAELDQPQQGEKIWIVRMRYTAASETAQKLAEIFRVEQMGRVRGGGAAAPAPAPAAGAKGRSAADLAAEMTISKMIPDERSNQLIIIANEKAYARLLTLIRKLDVPIGDGDGRIHIYYCENANCDELGQTLAAITGVAVQGGGGAGRSRRGAAAGTTPAPAPTPGSPAGQGQPLFLFEGDVRVSFDRPTNSLIILSSLKDYQALRRVIERLDSPRKQVFVEAIIMEVALDKTRTLGASFHGGGFVDTPEGQSLILGGFGARNTLSPGGLLSSSGDTLLGLAAGLIGPQIPNSAKALGVTQAAVVDIPAFGVLVNALQSNNDVNVLSTPHLLIMNNEDGEISVGQNLPFQGASFGGGAGGVPGVGGFPVGFATPVQRTDVALKMKLTPHVNEHDMIRLEVDHEIQDIISPNFNNLGPATSKRSAKTTVVARDQQTVVIGGLMADRTVERITKIPLLGDIPILGFFFRNNVKTIQKTNILIALTPYVISDQADLRRVLERKLKERREFVDRFGKQDVASREAEIDYRRKRGMLEEINRAAREAEEEEKAREAVELRDALEEAGPIDELPAGFKVPSSLSTEPGAPPPAAPAAGAPAAGAPTTGGVMAPPGGARPRRPGGLPSGASNPPPVPGAVPPPPGAPPPAPPPPPVPGATP